MRARAISLNRSSLQGELLIVITDRQRMGKVRGADIWRMTGFKIMPFTKGKKHLSERQAQLEERFLSSIHQLLSNDFFYFSYNYDMTRRVHLQNPSEDVGKLHGQQAPLWLRADPRFHFNRFLQRKLIQATLRDPEQDMSHFILPVISGFVEIKACEINGKKFQFGLISRRGVFRTGTRYFSRGIDSDGNVSNFVETEQVLVHEDLIYAHVQIRGSIPLFWRQVINFKYQPSLQVLPHVSTMDALTKHVRSLEDAYGDILAFNLVNSNGYEWPVGNAMTKRVQELNDSRVHYKHFDFHKECRKMQWHRISNLLNEYEKELHDQGYSVIQQQDGSVVRRQTSVVRTNCMDCLDRTNVVQSEVAKLFLTQQMRQAGILAATEMLEGATSFMKVYKNIWADHADAISLQYSGTGALKTDFTRTGKRTKAGALQDGVNSVVRYIKNNFTDGPRQDAFDLLLGRFDLAVIQTPPDLPPTTLRFYLVCRTLSDNF